MYQGLNCQEVTCESNCALVKLRPLRATIQASRCCTNRMASWWQSPRQFCSLGRQQVAALHTPAFLDWTTSTKGTDQALPWGRSCPRDRQEGLQSRSGTSKDGAPGGSAALKGSQRGLGGKRGAAGTPSSAKGRSGFQEQARGGQRAQGRRD